jgi:hypothetical protein
MTDRQPFRPLASDASNDPVIFRLGELARKLPAPRPLSAVGVERVRARLFAPGAPSFLGVRLRAAALGLAALALAGAAGAGWALVIRRPVEPPVERVDAPAPAAPHERVEPPKLFHAPPEAPSAVPEAPVPEVAAPRPPRPGPAGSSQLAEESRALEPALFALRRDRDPAKALALLELYFSRFPSGVLALEARVARIDATLALGRRDEALSLLERLPLERVGRGVELRLVRAELRGQADCRSALTDFDAVLLHSPGSSLEERALHGRSTCRGSLGDLAGARADAERYLAAYPSGRFADALRRRVAAP